MSKFSLLNSGFLKPHTNISTFTTIYQLPSTRFRMPISVRTAGHTP